MRAAVDSKFDISFDSRTSGIAQCVNLAQRIAKGTRTWAKVSGRLGSDLWGRRAGHATTTGGESSSAIVAELTENVVCVRNQTGEVKYILRRKCFWEPRAVEVEKTRGKDLHR